MNRPLQLDIEGREVRAPVLPEAFLRVWRQLEDEHHVPRSTPRCTSSTVVLDADGKEVPAAVVHFAVVVGGKTYTFIRPTSTVPDAARLVWAKSGRAL